MAAVLTSNPGAVATIYLIAGTVFLVGVFLAFVSTGARVLYYFRNHVERPRLLTRDVIVKGGYAISFGLIAAVRLLPQGVRDGLSLQTNVIWALVTSIPACVSVVTYLYFEWFVIEREAAP